MEIQLTSRDYIIEAFFLLLKEKNMNEISIAEICNKAGVSRVTYYRNFNEKIDIINAYFTTMIDRFVKTMGIVNTNYHDVAYHTFSLLKEEKENIKALINNNLDYLYLNLLNKYLTRNFKKIENTEMLAHIYAGALFNISIWWVKNDCKGNIDTLINEFFKICNFK